MASTQQRPTDLSSITRYILSLPWYDYLNTSEAALQQEHVMGMDTLEIVDCAIHSLISENRLNPILAALQQAYMMGTEAFVIVNHAVFVVDSIIEPFAPEYMDLDIWFWIFLMVLVIIAFFL